MSIYTDVVYRNYPKSQYPEKLARYLKDNYFLKSKSNLLEIGYGEGEYLNLFWEMDIRAYGVDKKSDTVNPMFERYCDLEKDNIPYPEDFFDYIYTKSMIEHVTNTDRLLKEAKRVLKTGGKIVILTPAWEFNYKDFYNDYTQTKPFHRKGLREALMITGFKDVKVDYFYHLPFMWNRPYLQFIPKILSMFYLWKWKDKEETIHRPLIRFSQEVQLIATAIK